MYFINSLHTEQALCTISLGSFILNYTTRGRTSLLHFLKTSSPAEDEAVMEDCEPSKRVKNILQWTALQCLLYHSC